MDNCRLSVIIPAYNEERRLPETLRQVSAYLASQSYNSEILVVDDGSVDGTVRIVQQMSASLENLWLLHHPDGTNHGKGAAVRRGMLAAAGDFRLFMDADNSTTIEQIESFWPWFDKGYDVVIGSRKIRGARIVSRQPRYKEIAGRLGNLIIRTLAVPGIEDTQAGFKMFTSRCAEEIFSRSTIERWGYDVEILALARAFGCRIREAPIVWANAPGSKVRIEAYFQVFADVWRIRRNLKSGRYRRTGNPSSAGR